MEEGSAGRSTDTPPFSPRRSKKRKTAYFMRDAPITKPAHGTPTVLALKWHDKKAESVLLVRKEMQSNVTNCLNRIAMYDAFNIKFTQ